MAIFSVRVSAHSRAKGESATGGAAYRLGISLKDEQTGFRHDFSRRDDVAAAFTLLPENAPAGWDDPARLWNEAERAEKRRNSCVSREVLVALPAELSDQQREELARAIAGDLVSRYGVGLSVGIHRPDDGGTNHHAHILMTTRRIGPDGLGAKTRELDDMKQGPAQVEAIRAMVSEETNNALQRYGYTQRVDHRTLEAQRLEALDAGDLERAATLTRKATQHRGRKPARAAAMAERNERTARQNELTQAEARTVFARLEEQARQEARLMEPRADGAKAAAAMNQEPARKEQRAGQQRATDKPLPAAVLDKERREREAQQAVELATARQARAAAQEAVREAEREGIEAHARAASAKAEEAKQEGKIGRRAKTIAAATPKREAWARVQKAHPILAALGLVGGKEREAAGKADAAARQARAELTAAQERRDAAKQAYATEQAHERAAAAAVKAAQEAYKRAKAAVERVREGHAWVNLTPEQQAAKRTAELDRMVNRWVPPSKRQQQEQEPPRQEQTQRPIFRPRGMRR